LSKSGKKDVSKEGKPNNLEAKFLEAKSPVNTISAFDFDEDDDGEAPRGGKTKRKPTQSSSTPKGYFTHDFLSGLPGSKFACIKLSLFHICFTVEPSTSFFDAMWLGVERQAQVGRFSSLSAQQSLVPKMIHQILWVMASLWLVPLIFDSSPHSS
jgi:hypothetical protein